MKITVGIDGNNDQTRSTISLLTALDFPQPQFNLVHVVEPWGANEMLLGIEGYMAHEATFEYMDLQKKQAKYALDFAFQEVLKHELPAKTHVLNGQVANQLIEFSKHSDTDLLALGTSHKGPVESVFMGGVGRKAVIHSECSVLIAKGRPIKGRKLKAVLATDHSDYINRCLHILTTLAPAGIGELIVTSVYQSSPFKAMPGISGQVTVDVDAMLERELTKSNENLIERLRPLGCSFSSRVEEGPVNDVLARVMIAEDADLLILGAQGHGFAQRLAMGSVSLKQALTEPKSVLILRAQ